MLSKSLTLKRHECSVCFLRNVFNLHVHLRRWVSRSHNSSLNSHHREGGFEPTQSTAKFMC